MKKLAWLGAAAALCLAACGDDDNQTPADSGVHDSGNHDAGNDSDGGNMSSMVERGRYIVEHVAACGDCHTPRKMDGTFDTTRLLSGVDCFVDVDPTDANVGCLSSRNLTNHETGLKNRTAQQIKDMFTKGQRPADSGGQPTALHPVMPYWVFGNMLDADADAIVAYLRTVPGVDHRVTARQAPFNVDAAAPRFPEAMIPMPRTDYTNQAAALRGRYLAGNIGICLECHTERNEMGMPLLDKAFQGGEAFPRAALGLPPIFPDIIYSANITPDATGIASWSVQDVVNALKLGQDKDQGGSPICPPMPAGPMQAFGGLTDDDATDIGHYLLSIPPGQNQIPEDCMAHPPVEADAGNTDGG